MSAPKGFNRIKKCRYGMMLFNPKDIYVGKSFDLYGEFSEGEVSLFRDLLVESATVLDIGANIGAHTVFFAQMVGIGGTIHAFEPQRLLFQTLCANMALNSLPNVHCYYAAVSDKCGSILVPPLDPHTEQNFSGLSLLSESDKGDEVDCITVDTLELSGCDFIKIDVEGMELDVIRGALQTIRRFSPILYVENDRPSKSPLLVRYLAGLNYDLYWHLPPLYNPDNYFGNKENIFSDTVSLNMLCLPKGHSWKPKGLSPVSIPRRKNARTDE
jgi:FkbM family methyltransferase